MKTTSLYHDADALQARFAARVAAGLSASAEAAPHDISERLRVAREQALVRARESRRAVAAAPAPVAVLAGRSAGALLLGGGPAWWQRAASVLPLAVLVAGLVMIQQHVVNEQVEAAAEIDTVLLADDLPPDAYSDPGFAEYLKTPQP